MLLPLNAENGEANGTQATNPLHFFQVFAPPGFFSNNKKVDYLFFFFFALVLCTIWKNLCTEIKRSPYHCPLQRLQPPNWAPWMGWSARFWIFPSGSLFSDSMNPIEHNKAFLVYLSIYFPNDPSHLSRTWQRVAWQSSGWFWNSQPTSPWRSDPHACTLPPPFSQTSYMVSETFSRKLLTPVAKSRSISELLIK